MSRTILLFGKSSYWTFSTKFMRQNNFVLLSAWRVRFYIGRPIIPKINRMIDKWEHTRFFYARKYYKACKHQVDLDLYYRDYMREIGHNQVELLADKVLKDDWNTKMNIIQYERLIPNWLRKRLDKRVERYYENEVARLATDEDIRFKD